MLWTNKHTGEVVGSGVITSNLCDRDEGWLRSEADGIDQHITLVPLPRHFGGVQWYFVCPIPAVVRGRRKKSNKCSVRMRAFCTTPGTESIGGPGRPKGSRNKLAEKFIDDVYTSSQTHGASALDRMATESPAKYCALIANLIPQHFKVEHDHTLTMSEDELRAKLLKIRAKLLDSMLTRTCWDRRPKRMRDSGWRSWWALRCWRFVPSALPTIESFTPRQTRHIIFFFTVHQDYLPAATSLPPSPRRSNSVINAQRFASARSPSLMLEGPPKSLIVAASNSPAPRP